jgi:hypothetical protein
LYPQNKSISWKMTYQEASGNFCYPNYLFLIVRDCKT